jgi:hypothetical protein
MPRSTTASVTKSRLRDGIALDSGRNVTVYSSRGSDTETDVYWGTTSGVWDDDGGTITVRTAGGRAVLREPYLK